MPSQAADLIVGTDVTDALVFQSNQVWRRFDPARNLAPRTAPLLREAASWFA
jgi:hypothetical protein